MTVLRGSVHKVKSRGPMTNPEELHKEVKIQMISSFGRMMFDIGRLERI